MLKELFVQNYALIDELRVSFPGKMTVITGETGAGKSILLGALGLILGKRAESGVLYDKGKKCIVEALFQIKAYKLEMFFASHDLDYANETTLRREVSTDGKSRAFINDTPVNLQILKSIAELLIDIHSQHETLMLSEKNFRFEVLDSFSGTETELTSYRYLFFQYKESLKYLSELKIKLVQAKKDQDYYAFQLNELNEVQLENMDLEGMELQVKSMENAELIKSNLLSAAHAIGGSEKNVLSAVSVIRNLITQLRNYGAEYVDYEKRITSIQVELKELERDFNFSSERQDFDPVKLEELNEKIDRWNRLLKKHALTKAHELIELKKSIEDKINSNEQLELEIQQLEKQLIQDEIELRNKAAIISEKRSVKIPELERSVLEILSKLNMPKSRLKIELTPLPDLSSDGFDAVSFLFSANKGGDYKELHKVASGGELSRLMLAIKSVIARHTSLPTILFDEIDTGVSGEVGASIGNILEEMSKDMQVISITHLPQIAGRGAHHLQVYKKEVKDKTFSYIKELSYEDRVEELAKMLSAGKATPASRKNAQELMRQRI